jgi:hypothetical protein
VTSAEKIVFTMRHRVILDAAAGPGDGAAAARQLDAVLLQAGFKCSAGLLAALSRLEPGYVIDKAVKVIGWAREMAGDHVRHNAYFIDFPANVPDTVEFWAGLLADAVREYARTGEMPAEAAAGPGGEVVLNLLSLPGYGRYRHSWEEMLARHDAFTDALSDRVTVLRLGGSLEEEAGALYGELAGSTVPLSGAGLGALRVLAEARIGCPQPQIAVRENRAVVSAVRVRAGVSPLPGTLTDVLRLAAELSGGDVTLTRPPRFRSMPRAWRRLLLEALAAAVAADDARLEDVPRHAEAWKRLGERLHPHESGSAAAARVFAVARGEERVRTVAGRAELAFARGDARAAAGELSSAPGMLWRAADRVLRTAGPGDAGRLMQHFEVTAGQVSGRVLLSVREHLQNRQGRPGLPRVFANRRGRAWAAADTRAPVDRGLLAELLAVIDAEVAGRLPDPGRLVVDPVMLGAALPLSGKPAPEGLGVWPRGSVTPVGGELLRFFVYWRQAARQTDFDLSAIFTDREWAGGDHVSYTSLRNFAAVHSGDITDAPAPEGASEFIDIDLSKVGLGYVIPQVYVFAGEGFAEVAEGFFGFMTRGRGQGGAPFEPRTVRMKSALAGDGRTAMPLVFFRGDDGAWYAKWLHLQLRGRAEAFGGVRVEENKVTSELLARSVMARDYLRVGYLAGLLQARAAARPQARGGPVTWIGVDEPEEVLPEGSVVYTPGNLASLIPA